MTKKREKNMPVGYISGAISKINVKYNGEKLFLKCAKNQHYYYVLGLIVELHQTPNS